MTQDELRKRAKEVLLAHSTKQSVTEHEVDAMLAFAAERVAAEREQCIRECRGIKVTSVSPTAIQIVYNLIIEEAIEAIKKGASDAAKD